ncbi:uncharacterized protein LOC109714127 [Ananas comosus]|uniref:Uncharacterized protein LOC109714127 n=1 Tax=Ananas comosus TaxID=4615 RepID=A0A6P5FD55_ANACO|nr:uncharacterized protein LOC109714127 [Ananas comosus]
MFVCHSSSGTPVLLLYVDDIIVTSSSSSLLDALIVTLQREFAMKDLGPLHYFLGIEVHRSRSPSGLHLSQQKYAHQLLQRHGFLDSKPVSTPLSPTSCLSSHEGHLLEDLYTYRQIVGALQYLTFTRPDISYAVNSVAQYLYTPREPHMQAVKRILRYIRGTLTYGLPISRCDNSSLVAFADADWAGCPDTRRSTSRYCIFLGPNLISWSAKKQPTISRSSSEAEYRAVAYTLAETVWIRRLLRDLRVFLWRSISIYCDNLSTTYLAASPVLHARTKHIELDHQFLRKKVQSGDLALIHIPSDKQLADIFTKPLTSSRFSILRLNLHIRPPDA